MASLSSELIKHLVNEINSIGKWQLSILIRGNVLIIKGSFIIIISSFDESDILV